MSAVAIHLSNKGGYVDVLSQSSVFSTLVGWFPNRGPQMHAPFFAFCFAFCLAFCLLLCLFGLLLLGEKARKTHDKFYAAE